MGRSPQEHALRRLPEPLWPVLAHEILVAADATRADDHRLRPQRELTGDRTRAGPPTSDVARLKDLTVDAVDHAVGRVQPGHPMPEAQGNEALCLGLAHAPDERLQDTGTGPPHDVEPRYGVTVSGCPVAPAFGPAHDGKKPHTLLAEPGALLRRGEVHIGFCPLPGPVVLLPVEACRTHPVLEREVVRILHPKPPLLRRVHEEQSPKRPKRLPTQGLLRFLIQHDHATPGRGKLGRSNQPREASYDNDHVRVIVHAHLKEPVTQVRASGNETSHGFVCFATSTRRSTPLHSIPASPHWSLALYH